MKILEVKEPAHKKEFLNLPAKIYANTPQFIFPLEKDIEAVFDPKKNKFFRHGECTRWILQNEAGETIGRVAAFINEKHAKQFKRRVGGMGFFEVIEDEAAAFLLMNTCKEWLLERDMDSMDGPINFGERDKFWGLLTSNFERSPYYNQNYNPPYYVPYFEAFGFEVFFKQLIFTRDVEAPLQKKFEERARLLSQDSDFTVRDMEFSKMEQYTEDFRTVYNQAWGKREGDTFKGMSKIQSKAIMKTMRPIMDPEICSFAYYKDQPIAFFIALPEINQIFKPLKGKFGLLQKIATFFRLKMRVCDVAIGLAFGITPEFQKKGVEGLIFQHLASSKTLKKRYKEFIITWIGDFNLKMINVIEGLGSKKEQEMATYRYLFDRTETFERHPFV